MPSLYEQARAMTQENTPVDKVAALRARHTMIEPWERTRRLRPIPEAVIDPETGLSYFVLIDNPFLRRDYAAEARAEAQVVLFERDVEASKGTPDER